MKDEQKVITDEAYLKARPWVCCKDPLLVERQARTNIPVVALCDKKWGHSGKHRGRVNGITFYWRTLSPTETARRRKNLTAKVEAANIRAARVPDMPEVVIDLGWWGKILNFIMRRMK
jgi:hypothetical protein